MVSRIIFQEFGKVYPGINFPTEDEIIGKDYLEVVNLLYQQILKRSRWHLHWEEGEVRSFSVGDLIRDGDFFAAIGELILEIGYQQGSFQEFLPFRYGKFIVSFKPLINRQAKVLILGTMPGNLSLQLNQYYVNPRNQFWKIMNHLINENLDVEYVERSQKLSENDIALWDVLQYCERDGSLDVNINENTVKANDFEALFNKYRNLRAVFFNGIKAQTLFQNQIIPLLPIETKQRLKFILLPSSSGTNSHQTLLEKVDEWQVIKKYLF